MRAPIWLYRARLGLLFGRRLLMLEHTGRKTGIRRYAVLEVIARPWPETYMVVSGLGERAQWFRNVQANPRVRVFLGSRRPAVAVARFLGHDEAAAALAAYASGHPRAWAALKPVLDSTLGTRLGDDAAELPVIALELDTSAIIQIAACNSGE